MWNVFAFPDTARDRHDVTGATECRITGGVIIPLRYIIAVDEIRD